MTSNMTSYNIKDPCPTNSTSRSVDREIEELEFQLRRIQLRCRDMVDGGLRMFKSDQPEEVTSNGVNREEPPSAASLLRIMGRQNENSTRVVGVTGDENWEVDEYHVCCQFMRPLRNSTCNDSLLHRYPRFLSSQKLEFNTLGDYRQTELIVSMIAK